MNCPLCDAIALTEKTLDEGLIVHDCPSCEGRWLSFSNYWGWLEKQGEILPEKSGDSATLDSIDTKQAMLCPECSHIMIKFKIGHGISFHLDRCGHCKGVWFDKNEWETLRERNLHDEIHRIFTTKWQKEIHSEMLAKQIKEVYEEKFGEGYDKIKDFKSWVELQGEKSAILAYLTNEDPYTL